LEIWPEAVLAIDRAAGAAPHYQFLADNEIPAFVDAWRASSAASSQSPALELLTATHRTIEGVDRFAAPIDLDRDDDLRRFAQAWAAAIERSPEAPAIVPLRKPLPQRTRRMLAVGAAALTVLACIGHYRYTAWANGENAVQLKSEVAELSRPAEEAKRINASISKLQKQLADRESQRQTLARDLAAYERRVDECRKRIPQLLESLARSSGAETLVTGIENSGSELTISGRCLDAHQATVLAEALAAELTPLGMDVTLARRDRLEGAAVVQANGGPFEFELVVRDATQR
jgi:hypothetical protein